MELLLHLTVCKQKTVYLCETELFKIELFDHLIVYKQMTDVLLNCMWYIAILESIKLCANKWLIVNRIIRIR